jgi:hypothetical protein
MSEYLLAKFLHVLIAILALGTSAGLGIVLEFYGDHPVHGSFVLRAIERIVAFFVLPGYAVMVVVVVRHDHEVHRRHRAKAHGHGLEALRAGPG